MVKTRGDSALGVPVSLCNKLEIGLGACTTNSLLYAMCLTDGMDT